MRACAPAVKARPPVRVCLLVGRYPPDFSGHGIQMQRTLPWLEREGVVPTVVTRMPAEGVAWPADEEAAVHRILPPGPGLALRIRRVAALRAHFRRHARDYDVVHAAFPDWELYLNLPLMKRLGLPVLYEMVLLGSDDPVSIGRQRLGGLKRRLLRGVDAWVGITDAFGPRVAEAGIAPGRFRRVYCGVDVERHRPADAGRRRAIRERLGLPPDARVVSSVGALMPRKGMDRLIRAWELVRPEPGRDVLVIAGPAAEAEGLRPQYLRHVEALRALAERPGVAGTVRFTGRLDDAHELLAASDVFAFLSLQEGFGTVIVEAMCCGLPCVVSPLDGIGREILGEDDAMGMVVDAPEDPAHAAAALRLLQTDP